MHGQSDVVKVLITEYRVDPTSTAKASSDIFAYAMVSVFVN